MFQIFRRIGFFRRRWVWALILLALFGLAGYWMVPWRGVDAELRLVALLPDGTFSQRVRGVPVGEAPAATPRSAARRDTAVVVAPAAPSRRGVPLILGVANGGRQSGRPERLVLSLPRWYRLIDPGPHVRRELPPDESLQRYVIEADFPAIQGGRVPTLLPALDTLWLEPWVPDYYCTADTDSVPQFIPSSFPDTSGIVPVHIFYSFEGADLARRQTGLLTVELPGEMFRREGATDIFVSPVQLQQPRAERPVMNGLFEGGSRRAECGPPGDPMIIFSALWLTIDGGRMISVHYGGQPRKEYYDLDRDSIIELEMWDPDGDGELEAWRRLSLRIPEYMLPEPPPPVVVASAPDSLAADSATMDSLRADSMPGMPAAPGLPRVRTGPTLDIATLGRMLIPGDLSRARRLFVRRAPAPPPPPDPDALLGEPVDTTPPADAEPDVPVDDEPEPETPEPAPPPGQKVPIGEPVDR